MSRPQPSAAQPWLLRGLLVLLTLAGLGVWLGGHCADVTASHHAGSVAAPSVTAASATATATASPAAAPATSPHNRRDLHTQAAPDTTADTCQVAPKLVVRTATTATVAVPVAGHPAPSAQLPQPPTPRCLAPAVTLTRLGVSRT